MYYLYDQHRLKPLRSTPDEAIALARFCDEILVTNRIEEAIRIAAYPKAAFLLHPKNALSLFGYWKYQMRHHTLKEFRIILYAAPKNLLYRILSWVASISFGTYRLIPFGKEYNPIQNRDKGMKVHALHYSCLLNASADRVCAFHTDTRNLPLITPPWIGVNIVRADIPVKEQSRIVLDIRRFGFKTRWEMEIAELDCPHTVTDVMLSGPFRQFRHERRFLPQPNGETLMEETLSIVLPFGWFGNLVFPFLKKDMDTMFAFRHRATERYFLTH
ncbi:MAG: SRPBCC family protein [Campylobacterales bacterium]|nr:SRPBCC family protein [Campylobacterales bacterium]